MRLNTLASGSKGNASFVASNDTALVVDCGISAKRLSESLKSLLIDPETLSGILITHEHSDHISGLKTFLKKYRIPVFSVAETFDAILRSRSGEGIDTSLLHGIEPDRPFTIGDICVKAFSIPHDAVRPVGYTFMREGKKIAICTDVGTVTEEVTENLKDASAMVLEANHDVHMLEAGSYPYRLKRRILGDYGHLSNETAGKLLTEIWNKNLKHVFLGHMSDENNLPELAVETVRCELLCNIKDYETHTVLSAADKHLPSETVVV